MSAKKNANPTQLNSTQLNITQRFDKTLNLMNSAVIQDVSTKVSGFIGKIFPKKPKEKEANKVLTPDFLKEINLQTCPNNESSPKRMQLYQFTTQTPSSSSSKNHWSIIYSQI